MSEGADTKDMARLILFVREGVCECEFHCMLCTHRCALTNTAMLHAVHPLVCFN